MARSPGPKAARPIRDCTHAGAPHEHGTRAAYVLDRCRCQPCTEQNAAAERRRSTSRVYGSPTSGLIDAEPARRHVTALREEGFSLVRIAALSGVGQGTINALIYGVPTRRRPPSTHVRADTAGRLLAVQFDPHKVAAGRRINATGTQRRLQALAARGWSIPQLALRSELPARTLRRALSSDSITAASARAVRELYEHLQHTPAPRRTPQEHATARKTAARARAAGWLPPQAWDDDIDDDGEHCEPGPPDQDVLDQVAVERAMSGQRVPLTPAERRAAVAQLTRRGLSARRIAELLHTTSRTIVRIRGVNRTAA